MIEENHAYSQIIGSPYTPHLNAIAASGVSLAAMFAVTHPSLPNYLALTSGSTQGATNDCGACTYGGDNLFHQMEQAHLGWRVYAQGYSGSCNTKAEYGAFVRRHVPPLAYRNILGDPTACSRVVPLERLWTDLAANTVPPLAMIIPDLTEDMHGTPSNSDQSTLLRAADALAGRVASALRASPIWEPGTRLVITWDEGGGALHEPRISCCGGRSHGGHIPTLVVGPDLPVSVDPADHDTYSLLRSIEDRLGLPRLGLAAVAPSADIAAVSASR